jgi:hypothetical protein
MDQLGIGLSFTSVRHPQANPVERYMRELGRLGRTYCSTEHTGWCKFMPKFEYWLNSSVHSTTNQIPAELQQQVLPEAILDVVSFPPNLQIVQLSALYETTHQTTIKKAEQRKIRHKKHHKMETYNIGTLVLLRANRISSVDHQEVKKFFPLYDGPYVISKVLHWDTYVLNEENGSERGIFNKSQLRRYHCRDVSMFT